MDRGVAPLLAKADKAMRTWIEGARMPRPSRTEMVRNLEADKLEQSGPLLIAPAVDIWAEF